MPTPHRPIAHRRTISTSLQACGSVFHSLMGLVIPVPVVMIETGRKEAGYARKRHTPELGGEPVAASGSGYSESEMRSVVVVIADVLIHQSVEMSLVEHDDMIKQVSSAISNPTFCDAVLLWATETGSFSCVKLLPYGLVLHEVTG